MMDSHHPETPFDNIESSHKYVTLLAEAIRETLADVEADIAMAGAEGAGATRRKEALQLIHFNLTKLAGQPDFRQPDSERFANVAAAASGRKITSRSVMRQEAD